MVCYIHFLTEESYLILPVNAAKRIQSHFRRAIERRKFLKILNAAAFLQTVFRAWLSVRQKPARIKFSTIQVQELACGMFLSVILSYPFMCGVFHEHDLFG